MLKMKFAAVLLLLLLAAARGCDAAPTDHQEHDEEVEEAEHEKLDEEVHQMHGLPCKRACPDDLDCERSITVPELCCPVCVKHKPSSSESISSESADCESIRCLAPDCTTPIRPPGNCCYVCL